MFTQYRVHITGKWTDVDTIRRMITDLTNEYVTVYDWTSDEHMSLPQCDQDTAITKSITYADVFIFVVTDPLYEYGASRLQFGYALLSGKLCIVIDSNFYSSSIDEQHRPRFLRNLYWNRVEDSNRNLRFVRSWADAMDIVLKKQKNKEDDVKRRHEQDAAEFMVGC